jgi:hypothetical protein
MPATVTADSSTINYFLSNYEGFAKQCDDFQQRHKLYEFKYEYSLFSDPEDYNKLILIGYDKDSEQEIERISVYEKGY